MPATSATRNRTSSHEPALLPIPDYDKLTVKEIVPLLGPLSDHERALLLAHERATKNRVTLLRSIQQVDPGPPPSEAGITPANGTRPEPSRVTHVTAAPADAELTTSGEVVTVTPEMESEETAAPAPRGRRAQARARKLAKQKAAADGKRSGADDSRGRHPASEVRSMEPDIEEREAAATSRPRLPAIHINWEREARPVGPAWNVEEALDADSFELEGLHRPEHLNGSEDLDRPEDLYPPEDRDRPEPLNRPENLNESEDLHRSEHLHGSDELREFEDLPEPEDSQVAWEIRDFADEVDEPGEAHSVTRPAYDVDEPIEDMRPSAPVSVIPQPVEVQAPPPPVDVVVERVEVRRPPKPVRPSKPVRPPKPVRVAKPVRPPKPVRVAQEPTEARRPSPRAYAVDQPIEDMRPSEPAWTADRVLTQPLPPRPAWMTEEPTVVAPPAAPAPKEPALKSILSAIGVGGQERRTSVLWVAAAIAAILVGILIGMVTTSTSPPATAGLPQAYSVTYVMPQSPT